LIGAIALSLAIAGPGGAETESAPNRAFRAQLTQSVQAETFAQ
jgi:hypothetical protein